MAAGSAVRSVVHRPALSPHRRGALVACALAALAWISPAPGWGFVPAKLIDAGPQSLFASGSLPGGGYLFVWEDPADFRLTAQRFTAAGRPLAAAKVLDVGAVDEQVSVSSVAVGDSGAWGVFWVEGAGADQIGVGGALFDAKDRLLQRMSFPDPVPDPGGLIISYHPLAVALAGGGYLVAFEVGTQEDPTADPLRPTRSDVYVMKLDAAGRIQGSARLLNQTTQGYQHLTDVGGNKDHVVVSWDSLPGDPSTSAVRARFLDGNLTPAGPETHVAEPDGSASGTLHSSLAVGADGSTVLVWEGTDSAALGGAAGRGIRIRAYGPAGEPAGAEQAANAAAPGDRLAPQATLTREGTVWVAWVTSGNLAPSGDVFASVISVRPFDLAAKPAAGAQDVATTIAAGPFLTGGRGGALVAWRREPSDPEVVGFVAGPAGGQSGPPSAPFAIEGPELPGFRAWVRFSPANSAQIWATPLEPCLAQALCAAGAVPARAEVIVRIIGPRGNGFLWPQAVRFTTDLTEVWLQRKATGDIRYYLLPQGDPGTETLTGLLDRHGFFP